jgi:hypothetical protein
MARSVDHSRSHTLLRLVSPQLKFEMQTPGVDPNNQLQVFFGKNYKFKL